ncbi:ABC transporter ATP-binding protein [Anaerosporobacter faecicola]|uniref:ABC transporter ATP-binding protein n=1 Tax=Anaerosporobacter faecicola TaxID=2718714 RepID=UPI001438970D|nr:ATP-binding cassette domain-containing protein [Anaerosporobacter faecicola]
MYCIEVENLTKTFGNLVAVDHINFKVEKGELFGFLGVNGAGKSTTINMLCTLLEPQSGNVKVCGLDLGKEDTKIRNKIGVVFQGNTLDELLTVKQNLELRACLYEKDRTIRKKNLAYIYEMLELKDILKRYYKDLSGGQKRRCEIARALVNRPEILFLDEPTTGLDPMTRQMVWQVLERMQKELGMTIFLTTHYMEEAVKANHIGIMDTGKLIQYDTPYQLKEKFAYDQLRLYTQEQGQLNNVLTQWFTKNRDIMIAEKNKTISQESKITGFDNIVQKSGYIMVPLKKTVDAMPILQEVRPYIQGFEVVQGTMDDVFLNVTGRQLDN